MSLNLPSVLNPIFLYRRLPKVLGAIANDPIRVLTDDHLYALIGFLGLLPLIKHALSGLAHAFQRKSLQDIARLYKPTTDSDENASWVVVTGATSGIGKSFCEEFARLGFNLVAVSRDQDKLSQLELEILAINSLVKVKTVQVDFTQDYTQKALEEKVTNQIKDLDISILVNNVGLGGCYVFHELNSSKIYDTIRTNITPQIYLTKGLITGLIRRNATHKTAVINISSNLGTEVFLPYFSVYSATKAFNDYFSKTLAQEYPNIDVLSARPGRTQTAMNPNGKVTPQSQVVGILSALGVSRETTGTFKSYFEANVGPSFYWLVKGFIRKGVYSTYDRKYRREMVSTKYDLHFHNY